MGREIPSFERDTADIVTTGRLLGMGEGLPLGLVALHAIRLKETDGVKDTGQLVPDEEVEVASEPLA